MIFCTKCLGSLNRCERGHMWCPKCEGHDLCHECECDVPWWMHPEACANEPA